MTTRRGFFSMLCGSAVAMLMPALPKRPAVATARMEFTLDLEGLKEDIKAMNEVADQIPTHTWEQGNGPRADVFVKGEGPLPCVRCNVNAGWADVNIQDANGRYLFDRYDRPSEQRLYGKVEVRPL